MNNIKNFKVKLVFFILSIFIATPICTLASEIKMISESTKRRVKSVHTEKVSTKLRQAFSDNEFVEVLVELNEQIDADKVYENTSKRVQSSSTKYEKKMTCRYAVVDALKTVAEDSQREIIKYLESEKKNGQVQEINSFFIVNMIHVKTTLGVVENLSTFSEVKGIRLDEKFEVDRVEVPEVITSATKNHNEEKENKEEKEDSKESVIAWGIDKIDAPEVWSNYGVDGKGVVVGIIDTGVDWTHEALKEKWRGYNPKDSDRINAPGNWFDAVSNELEPYDGASNPHGTHVTGTILGQDPDGINKVGVAPGAKWIAAKALDGNSGQISSLLAAGQWMLAPDGDPSLAPDIINNSWSLGAGKDEWYRSMVKSWRAAGILPVFAAGNTHGGSVPGSICNPGNYPESFAVAAVDINNKRGGFSNQGPGPYDEVKPDIAAPGVEVLSTVPGGYAHEGWSGTSMAAPHIAGIAALLLSMDASLTPDQLEEIMMSTVKPLTDSQYPTSPNYGYGVGLVNAFDAVSSLTCGLGVIKGTVLKEGNDKELPSIIHEPFKEAFEKADIIVDANIKDNVSITKVEITVRNHENKDWVIIPMNKISGDYKEATYSASIPYKYITDSGFEYQINAYDYGDNIGQTEIYNVKNKFGIKPDEYITDFTKSPIGWRLNGDWQWGVPEEKSGNSPRPLKGKKLIGTNLAGDYSEGSSTLIMPPLDLRNTKDASLHVNHWYWTETQKDNCVVSVSVDNGETWNKVKEYTGFDREWQEMSISLRPYCGSNTPVLVSFTLEADESIGFKGWYIDGVKVVGVDKEAPNAPKELTGKFNVSQVELKWNEVEDQYLAGYKVYRTTTSQGMNFIGDTRKTELIDKDLQNSGKYTYRVSAYDLSGNESKLSNEVEVYVADAKSACSSDFEENNGDWTTAGRKNTWEWGTPLSGPRRACSGKKLWATSLRFKYKSDSDSWIESPKIKLSSTTPSAISFNHWYETEENRDKCNVKISNNDGEDWTILKEYTGESLIWEKEKISLENYMGDTIRVRFEMKSDASVEESGWYIDDVTIATSKKHRNKEIHSSTERLEEVEHIELDSYESKQNCNMKLDKDSMVGITSGLLIDKGLPIDAVVTILESGRSVRTSPADGSFMMNHPASDIGKPWTVCIESYGYHTLKEKICLKDKEAFYKNFRLSKIPEGRILGKIVSDRTGQPIKGARVKVVEDLRILSVVTDENGNFALENVLEGKYTLKISAPEHDMKEISVDVIGNKENFEDITLTPFIGYESEISYDDGKAEGERALMKAGDGHAVKMKPEKLGLLTGARVHLSEKFPLPGDNKFYIAVFDTDKNGEAGEMVFKTDIIEGVRGKWNYVDVSKFGFVAEKEFFLAVLQDDGSPNCPGISLDEDEPHSERSYKYEGGNFISLRHDGNLLLRANMRYALEVPMIVNLGEETHTNKDFVMVSGIVNHNSEVSILNNGKVEQVVKTDNNKFQAKVSLQEGKNIITTKGTAGFGDTDPSAPKLVIRDNVTPTLEVISPIEGFNTNREIVEITGRVKDENLDKLLLNGEKFKVSEDGHFNGKVIVVNGENTVTIEAIDKAGNSVLEERIVNAKLDDQVITKINPDTDTIVKSGEEIKISFESNKNNSNAYFTICLPDGQKVEGLSHKNEMKEVKNGYYEGTWQVPNKVELKGAIIELELCDVDGNITKKIAPGKIYANSNIPLNYSYVTKIKEIGVERVLDSIVINADIENIDSKEQSPMLIVRVTDENNMVVNISTTKVEELEIGKTIRLGSGFGTSKSGQYNVKIFVWDSLENMKSLSSTEITNFSIK